jgi:hypothetical protein
VPLETGRNQEDLKTVLGLATSSLQRVDDHVDSNAP